MAKRLIWAKRAEREFNRILKFWNENNGNKIYSIKLRKRIRETLAIVIENNSIGKATSDPGIRVTVCENYLIYYEILPDEIVIISIFDGRRNPYDLKIR